MIKFSRLDIAQVIRESAKKLDIPIVSIFREANVDHTNLNKWEKAGDKKAKPNRRTEDKILEAIERLSKAKTKQKSASQVGANP